MVEVVAEVELARFEVIQPPLLGLLGTVRQENSKLETAP